MDNSETYDLIRINGHFLTFCGTDKFKTSVRAAVNDEMFWRDLIQRCNVSSLVKDELARQLPPLVKSESQTIVTNLAESKFNNFISINLPGHIANELNRQVPVYLNNNGQMQQILNTHSHYLNHQLEALATETLSNLVNEPQYQIVTAAHLNSMQEKCDKKIAEIQNTHDAKLKENDRAMTLQMKTMKNDYDRDLGSLKEKLDSVNKLTDKVVILERENHSMKWLIGGISLFFLGIIGLGAYSVSKK